MLRPFGIITNKASYSLGFKLIDKSPNIDMKIINLTIL